MDKVKKLGLVVTGGLLISSLASYIFWKGKKTKKRKKAPSPKPKKKEESKAPTKRKQSLTLELLLMNQMNIEKVEHLHDWLNPGEEMNEIWNPLLLRSEEEAPSWTEHSSGCVLPESSFVKQGVFCLSQKQYHTLEEVKFAKKYMKAGPKMNIYFRPSEVKACIVTCGGLCPGLNVVIREIVMGLWYSYGVRCISGVKWGFKGFYTDSEESWIELTPSIVKDIHHLGGTLLGSSRGGFSEEDNTDRDKILAALKARGINHMYCIGGDGTHRAIKKLADKIKEEKLRISIVGVPKTIDNDLAVMDKTFGFETAVEVAQLAIESANIEANSAQNGVGLVKLMGRYAGHIALHASLASRDVNLCLVPEFKFDVYGKYGVAQHVCERLKKKDHMVIVIAEGAAAAMRDVVFMKQGEEDKDPSGNLKLIDAGSFLKKELVQYGKNVGGINITLKYIDPTYMIRSGKANAADRYLCAILAHNAVHGAMAGYTCFTCGIIKGVSVIIPVDELAKAKTAIIQKNDRAWQRLIASNGQPMLLNPGEPEYHKFYL